ncbi:hypothetical protein IKE67_09165 [bacterium]|nr:hypothetical protein [bacterium]
MSVDGFSMSSLGVKDITSAQAAAATEHAVNTGNDKVVGKIDRALNKRINNEEKEENQKNQYFNDGYKNEDEDENENENEEGKAFVDKDEKITTKKARSIKSTLIKDPENVIITVNNKTDKIELYNKVTKRIVETINATDFLEMINKLDYNSGIIVNKLI